MGESSTLPNGHSKVLYNAMAVGGCTDYRYECLRSNVISVTRGWGASNFQKNVLRNRLEPFLRNVNPRSIS